MWFNISLGSSWLFWVKGNWIINHLKRPAASILPCLSTSCGLNLCPPVVLSYRLPLLTAFCLCVFPVCTCVAGWWKGHDHDERSPLTPLILWRRKGRGCLMAMPCWYDRTLCDILSSIPSGSAWQWSLFCLLFTLLPCRSGQKKGMFGSVAWLHTINK